MVRPAPPAGSPYRSPSIWEPRRSSQQAAMPPPCHQLPIWART
jgi:hypothetical protein